MRFPARINFTTHDLELEQEKAHYATVHERLKCFQWKFCCFCLLALKLQGFRALFFYKCATRQPRQMAGFPSKCAKSEEKTYTRAARRLAIG